MGVCGGGGCYVERGGDVFHGSAVRVCNDGGNNTLRCRKENSYVYSIQLQKLALVEDGVGLWDGTKRQCRGSNHGGFYVAAHCSRYGWDEWGLGRVEKTDGNLTVITVLEEFVDMAFNAGVTVRDGIF